eukprot:s3059_g3.t1
MWALLPPKLREEVVGLGKSTLSLMQSCCEPGSSHRRCRCKLRGAIRPTAGALCIKLDSQQFESDCACQNL